MTAPRSVWVLVWPDGHTGVTFQTYDAAETMHARIGDPAVVIIRYDIAGAVHGTRYVSVASASPLPSAAPEPDVAPASPHGPVAVPAGDGGGHDSRGGRERGAMPAGSGHKSSLGQTTRAVLTSDPSPTLVTEFPDRHPCIHPGCEHTVQFDDEPWCYGHSPDEGSSVRGYSWRRESGTP